MIDYPSKVCNTSAMGTFFIVTFSDRGWNWVQKDAKNDIEAYNITYPNSSKQAVFAFITLIGSLIVRISVDHCCFECVCH